ncbi:MAG: riboflavin kinase, partial [Clostridium sp.]
TIDGERPAGVETYIYGMNEDLYGKWIEVRLLEFIRPEEKFADVEMLKRQVTADKETGYRMHQERASESSSKKD